MFNCTEATLAPASGSESGRADSNSPIFTVDGPRILVSVHINGVNITIAKRNLEHFDAQDPYFFDSDYTIAGSTGFLLWEANWLLLRLLRSTPLLLCTSQPHDRENPEHHVPGHPPPDGGPSPATLHSGPAPATEESVPLGAAHGGLATLLAGRRVLDLGSGTGLAGLCAASCGAHVLLTDLASICAGSLRANLERNGTSVEEEGKQQLAAGPAAEQAEGNEVAAPSATAAAAVAAEGMGGPVQKADQADKAETTALVPAAVFKAAEPWAGSVRVGRGSAAVMALDWTEPLEAQVAAGGNDPRDADFILAVDTIWLQDIFHCFIDVVLAVLSKQPNALQSAAQPDPKASIAATAADGSNIARVTGPAVTAGASDGTHTQRACFMAFVERAGEGSKLFVRKEAVEAELRSRGCRVETLLAEDVDVDGVARPGRVLRVTLAAA